MSPSVNSISVVVPVYNGAARLDALVARLSAVLGRLAERYEIILVNDGSADASWKKIEALMAADKRVRGIELGRNFGQHNALLCGIRTAQYELIATLDDDLQNPPEELPRLIAKLSEGNDVVYGFPDVEQHGLWRNLSSRVTKSLLQNAIGAENAGHISAYRLFRTPLRDCFREFRSPFVNIDVLLNWGTSRFSYVVVRHEARTEGTSNYSLRSLIRHAINMFTGFSTLPLQLASLLGVGFTLLGIGILAYVLVSWLRVGSVVPGFPFLASMIAIFSGGQFLALGIMGEYLARMHFRMLERPSYFVRNAESAPPYKNAA